ncbi:GH1 family beta-glucosidase [Thermopolyspora sp. NPDC052614]|uniref:GH1 family beta-glucosidase n=1 Tax=Thermopolyspora sp. NPDC052614 TaxID=3155682 RepID=UPI00341B7A39
MTDPRRFPSDIILGAATSAYQIEGAVDADGRGPSVWDTFAATPGKVADGDTGEPGADHYHRWADDVDLMASLGLQSYRFSIAWPRIQPDGSGPVNPKGLDFYRRLVDGLRERGIRPMPTLFHWDLPQALQDQGGWENRDVAKRFADYARIMFDALDVRDWLTLNEPKTVVEAGYQHGVHAPGFRDDARAYVALHHLLLAHGLAVQALRSSGGDRRIGPALNLTPVYPAGSGPKSQRAVRHADGLENRLYLDPILKGHYPDDTLQWIAARSPMPTLIADGDLTIISERVDLLGVQYYTPRYVTDDGEREYRHPTTQAWWQEIHAEGMYDLLLRITRDYGDVPLVITENGMPAPDEPDADGAVRDPWRVNFLRDHLDAVRRAVADGARVEGYHLWSLLDNFEWAEGYRQRWGIVYVDYATQRRTLKDSALWYRDFIKTRDLR